MSNNDQDYKNISSNCFLSQETASQDSDNEQEDYVENIDSQKIPDMKEYPVRKTSFTKIRYVQKQS